MNAGIGQLSGTLISVFLLKSKSGIHKRSDLGQVAPIPGFIALTVERWIRPVRRSQETSIYFRITRQKSDERVVFDFAAGMLLSDFSQFKRNPFFHQIQG